KRGGSRDMRILARYPGPDDLDDCSTYRDRDIWPDVAVGHPVRQRWYLSPDLLEIRQIECGLNHRRLIWRDRQGGAPGIDDHRAPVAPLAIVSRTPLSGRDHERAV